MGGVQIHREGDKIRKTSFEKAILTQLVAFDSKFNYEVNLENINSMGEKEIVKKTHLENFGILLQKTEYFKNSHPSFKQFSKFIYDSEYSEKNSDKIMVIKSQIDLSKILSKAKLSKNEKFLENFNSSKEKSVLDLINKKVDVIVSFDSCGVHSARFDFNLNHIETPKLIEITDSTCNLIEAFFSDLKKDLVDKRIINEDILSNHMIYSVISTTKAYFNPFEKKMDILGISWKNKDYETVNYNILEQITKKDVAIHKGDILTVTPQAALMVIPDLKDELYNDYVEERINAIEIFWRQKLLLKKMNFELDDLFSKVKELKGKNRLNSAIKRIQIMQITIESELEVYRNTIISVTDSFSMLFDTLNEVFKTKDHYNFVQEKLKAAKSIYENLNEERRNDLMENIQWIVVIIGLTTIFLTLLTVIYGPTFGPNQTNNIILMIVTVLIIGFSLIIFKTRIRRIFIKV